MSLKKYTAIARKKSLQLSCILFSRIMYFILLKVQWTFVYTRERASFSTARALCEIPFLMSIPNCANDSS